MNTLLAFAIFSTLPLLLLWACYKGILSKCNYSFRFNRAFIFICLTAIVASFAIGRLHIPDGRTSMPVATTASVQAPQAAAEKENKADADIAVIPTPTPKPDYHYPIALLYALGLTFVACGTAISLIRILKIRRKCSIRYIGHTKIYVSNDAKVAPMSIGRSIIMNERDFNSNVDMIVAHELAHVENAHTVDMLVIQILSVICWFNPAVWALRSQLRKLHEFQADDEVIALGHDASAYQKILILNSATNTRTQFASYLTYRQLKSRIAMMNAKKATWPHLLWLVPAIALSIAAISACTDSVEKAIDTACESPTPTFESYEVYKNTGTTVSVRENSLRKKPEYDENTAFVIYGVDMNSENFKKGDFLWLGDLPYSDNPDAAYDGFSYPFSRAIVTLHKGTVDLLAPDINTYIIDGGKASRAQFDALPGDSIQSVTIDGKTLFVEKRFYLDEPNVDIPKLGDDEGRMVRQTFKKELEQAAIGKR